jgi:hypothetical protein
MSHTLSQLRDTEFKGQSVESWWKKHKLEDGKEDMVPRYVHIYSSARNREAFPSPGQYQVLLERPIENIVRAELIQANFPLSEPVIHRGNQHFQFQVYTNEDSPVHEISIPIGTYSPTQLAREITLQCNKILFAHELS